jgi:hypothetical protein
MTTLRERLAALAAAPSDWRLLELREAALLLGARMALEDAAQACIDEYVDADATQEESDRAYNRACDDCERAIRALRDGLDGE